MKQENKIEIFHDVMETCIHQCWLVYLGIDTEIPENKEIAEATKPALTFAMFSYKNFPDDDVQMVHAIHDKLDAPMKSHPINLHLSPDIFFPSYQADAREMEVITLDNPTPVEVFLQVETYYLGLGSPETDKIYFEGISPMSEGGSPSDFKPFMGS